MYPHFDFPPDHEAVVVFTSGSTGRATPHVKLWGSLAKGAALARQRFAIRPGTGIVATVPQQHMYGLETSIMIPLLSGACMHGGRPFFPEDIRLALEAMPRPRLLITTPVHLKTCVAAGLRWPVTDRVISATAPLAPQLAAEVEQAMHTEVWEIYGCTEGGSLASRRTVAGLPWQLYDGLALSEQQGEFSVAGGHLPAAVALTDLLHRHDNTRFELLGRHADLVNIAGKRVLLSDLSQKLNDIEGVRDGVFLLPEENAPEQGLITRPAALVVAPDLDEQTILQQLAQRMEAVFLPRPLYKVERLPRNATGKLPRGALLDLFSELNDAS